MSRDRILVILPNHIYQISDHLFIIAYTADLSPQAQMIHKSFPNSSRHSCTHCETQGVGKIDEKEVNAKKAMNNGVM